MYLKCIRSIYQSDFSIILQRPTIFIVKKILLPSPASSKGWRGGYIRSVAILDRGLATQHTSLYSSDRYNIPHSPPPYHRDQTKGKGQLQPLTQAKYQKHASKHVIYALIICYIVVQHKCFNQLFSTLFNNVGLCS